MMTEYSRDSIEYSARNSNSFLTFIEKDIEKMYNYMIIGKLCKYGSLYSDLGIF